MDTLDKKLMAVIDQLADSVRASKIISINAALLADQIQRGRLQTAAGIKAVATEIQRLSDESTTGIDALQRILADVKLLTQTINLAGRQRMLSQRIMKIFLVQRETPSSEQDEELHRLCGEFQGALERLRLCRLNTPQLRAQLARSADAWSAFRGALEAGDVAEAIRLNDRLLYEVHAAVQCYEALAGSTVAVA